MNPVGLSKIAERALAKAGEHHGSQKQRHVDDDEQKDFEKKLNQKDDSSAKSSETEGTASDKVQFNPADPHSILRHRQHKNHTKHNTSKISSTSESEAAHRGKPQTLSRAIWHRVQEFQHNYEAGSQRAEDALQHSIDSKDVSPEDLMKVQIEMVKLGAQVEFVTKFSDKVSSGFQTLMNRNN